jgi:hypothetical protein
MFKGRIKFSNKDYYSGELEINLSKLNYHIEGKGKYQYANGDVYRGFFDDGLRAG